jgi:hypothetical protein
MSTNLFSIKTVVITLFAILILSNIAWAGTLYYTFNTKIDKAVLVQNQEKLNLLDVNLPSSKYNSYNLQNPETLQKVKKDLDKVQRLTSGVVKTFENVNLKGLESQSSSNIQEFVTKQKEFEASKKQVDCIIKGYDNSGGGNNIFSYGGGTTDVSKSTKKMEELVSDAIKCGLVISEAQKRDILANSKLMIESQNQGFMNQKVYQSKFEYKQPTAQEMMEQDQFYQEQNKINTSFADSIMNVVREKYEPLVDFTEYLKDVSF